MNLPIAFVHERLGVNYKRNCKIFISSCEKVKVKLALEQAMKAQWGVEV
jgi:hypothetical protein